MRSNKKGGQKNLIIKTWLKSTEDIIILSHPSMFPIVCWGAFFFCQSRRGINNACQSNIYEYFTCDTVVEIEGFV